MLLSGLLIIATLLYGGLIYYFKVGWEALPSGPKPTPQHTDWPTVAIIIPARNEENNIATLLEALQGQSYPRNLIEIIVLDDGSADQTPTIVQQYPPVKLIRPNNQEGFGGKVGASVRRGSPGRARR